MNNVAALQNQLALDVAQRMQSIEDLLDGKNAAPSKPDPEVEAWKALLFDLQVLGDASLNLLVLGVELL